MLDSCLALTTDQALPEDSVAELAEEALSIDWARLCWQLASASSSHGAEGFLPLRLDAREQSTLQ